MLEIIEAFARAMRKAGIEPPAEIIADGKLHRFPTNGRRGDDAGWYVLYGDSHPAGVFGDWRTDATGTWRADIGRRLTPEEEAERRRRLEEAKRQAEEERRRRAAKAAALAGEVWSSAQDARADHPYLRRKGVKPTPTLREMPIDELERRIGYTPQARGEPLQGHILIAPVRNASDIASLEFIDEMGRKSALSGGTKSGCYWATAKLPAQGRIVLAEGVATALSIAEALGEPVAAALSVGNLAAAAKTIRQLSPGAEIVIAADLRKDADEPHPEAVKAARDIGCALALPSFKARPADATDFNDLHQAQGLEAVRRGIRAASRVSRDVVRLVSLAEITPEPVRWLWDGWIAQGKLHLLAGKPGTGKTTLALTLAATVTRGGEWPDGSRCAQPGEVIVWSAEDDPADTIRPRLMAAGADSQRVHLIADVRGADGKIRPFDPACDVPLLAERLKAIRPALLILDPVIAAVTGDSHKNAETRRALQPLVDLAAEAGCAVVGITHLTKGSQGREPLERVIGSIAFAALARVVLLAAKDENPGPDKPPRLLVRAKSNLGTDEGGIGYDLEQAEPVMGIRVSRVKWLGAVEGSAQQLMSKAEVLPADDDGSELPAAVRFLHSLLEDGPLPTKIIRAEADGAGFSWATIRRAKDRLGVEAIKEGGVFGGKGAVWKWHLPQDAQIATRCSTKNDEHLVEGMSTLCKDGDQDGAEAEAFL